MSWLTYHLILGVVRLEPGDTDVDVPISALTGGPIGGSKCKPAGGINGATEVQKFCASVLGDNNRFYGHTSNSICGLRRASVAGEKRKAIIVPPAVGGAVVKVEQGGKVKSKERNANGREIQRMHLLSV